MTVWSLTDFLLRGRVCLVSGAKEENARDISLGCFVLNCAQMVPTGTE